MTTPPRSARVVAYRARLVPSPFTRAGGTPLAPHVQEVALGDRQQLPQHADGECGDHLRDAT